MAHQLTWIASQMHSQPISSCELHSKHIHSPSAAYIQKASTDYQLICTASTVCCPDATCWLSEACKRIVDGCGEFHRQCSNILVDRKKHKGCTHTDSWKRQLTRAHSMLTLLRKLKVCSVRTNRQAYMHHLCMLTCIAVSLHFCFVNLCLGTLLHSCEAKACMRTWAIHAWAQLTAAANTAGDVLMQSQESPQKHIHACAARPLSALWLRCTNSMTAQLLK